MALCADCQKKQLNVAATPHIITCEICYREKETEIPNAVICRECAELSDFCEVCKESIENY